MTLSDLCWVCGLLLAICVLAVSTQTQVRSVIGGQYTCEGVDMDGTHYTIPMLAVVKDTTVLMTWNGDKPDVQRLYGLGVIHRGVLSAVFRDLAGSVTGLVIYDLIGQVLDGQQSVMGAPGQFTPERCTPADAKRVEG